MLGAFAGLVIYIIYKQVKNKTYKNIAVYAAEFIFGFIIGSMPAILYFGLNNAFDSLFQVYFYNLLFIYNSNISSVVFSFFFKLVNLSI